MAREIATDTDYTRSKFFVFAIGKHYFALIFVLLSCLMRLLAAILLFLYGVAFLKPYMPYIEFALHQQEIAANLCENKNKPELHCNGHCYLLRQIRATQKAATPALPSAEKTASEILLHLRVETAQGSTPVAPPRIAYATRRYALGSTQTTAEVPCPPPQFAYF
jgi:hypothetical protein